MQTNEQAFRIAELIKKHLQQRLSAAEENELAGWLSSDVQNQKLFEELTDEYKLAKELAFFQSLSTEAARDKINRKIPSSPVRSINRYLRTWWAAAAILILISAGIFTLFNKTSKDQPIAGKQAPASEIITPGGNKAVLTLADGTTIILDSAANGTLSQQGNSKVIKKENGQLAYQSSNAAQAAIQYNTVTTIRGGQYQLILSDGSKVWLNAASSLRFPASFAGKERSVELTGEGYFEVARNPAMPFKVKINGESEVSVLGTAFNINAYPDERTMNTTLIEGSVNFTAVNGESVKLKPGQQAQSGSAVSVINNVDIDEITAWKSGWFNFDRADIASIMRQVSRWYNVEVVFQGQPSKKTFSGIVSRSHQISEVLKIMEKAGVRFRIDGRKITVL